MHEIIDGILDVLSALNSMVHANRLWLILLSLVVLILLLDYISRMIKERRGEQK